MIPFIFSIAVFAPNAFSPDADGYNDTWKVVGQGLENYNLYVFNRWGQEVFYAEGYQNDWNGHYGNNSGPLPDASYYYQIDIDGNGSLDYDGWIYITK